MKYKIDDVVIPHEFDGNSHICFNPDMCGLINKPAPIEAIDENFSFYKVGVHWWPESALTPYEHTPQYDLKEFVLAALTGLLSKSDVAPNEPDGIYICKLAVKIGKATKELLENELNKEA